MDRVIELGECFGMNPVIVLCVFLTPVLTFVLDIVRFVLFSGNLAAAVVPADPDGPAALPSNCPLALFSDSARVFFTLMLFVSLSMVKSPVFLSQISTHSFAYFFWLPLNTVFGTPDPSRCGTVTWT